MTAFGIAYAMDLVHGACVAVHLPSYDANVDGHVARLSPEERAHVARLGTRRRVAWLGGRIALRAAAARAGVPLLDAILSTPRGAPLLPAGVAGSVSHKDTIAVALAAPADGAARGIDIELDARRRIDVASKVLRAEELAEVDALPADERARAVLLRFSMKESIYKALDPFVGRYVAFHEARVTPRDDGSADATLHLDRDDAPFDVDVRWMQCDGAFVTTARIRESRRR